MRGKTPLKTKPGTADEEGVGGLRRRDRLGNRSGSIRMAGSETCRRNCGERNAPRSSRKWVCLTFWRQSYPELVCRVCLGVQQPLNHSLQFGDGRPLCCNFTSQLLNFFFRDNSEKFSGSSPESCLLSLCLGRKHRNRARAKSIQAPNELANAWLFSRMFREAGPVPMCTSEVRINGSLDRQPRRSVRRGHSSHSRSDERPERPFWRGMKSRPIP